MAIDYEWLRSNVVDRLIGENGKTIYIVTPGANIGEDYDPVYEDPVYEDPTETPVYFVETDWTKTDADKSLVQVADKIGLMSTEGGIVPDPITNTVRIDDTIYQFVTCKPLQPGSVTMLYKLILRK